MVGDAVQSATDLPVAILGAGRQGRNVAQMLRDAGRPILGFLDDTKPAGSRVDDVVVLGGLDQVSDAKLLSAAAIHVAIGNCAARARISGSLLSSGASLASAIHPSAVISPHARLGRGVYVAPFVRIAPGARIGDGCLIESHCLIGVDCALGDFAMLGPHCALIAGTSVGAGSFLGAGTSVTGKAIGRGCVVGAGSVVVHEVPDFMRAQGVPARLVGPVDPARPPV